MIDRTRLVSFQRILLSWFSTNGRSLLWREKTEDSQFLRDPYRILVSELMLQQTQVSRVLPKFEAFVQKWPSFASLAQAKQSDVVIAWAGLGYNRRAKYLWQTAQIIMTRYHGVFPTDIEAIESLPGIGPYTAKALAIFALGKHEATIDTNVRRILRRVAFGYDPVPDHMLHRFALAVVPDAQADDWHQALMDFGSLVCLSKPLCEVCPLASICELNIYAKQHGYASAATLLAAEPKKKKISHKDTGKRFEETDRYFRGRIIDVLRSSALPMADVYAHLRDNHGLRDRARFGELIEGLVREGMITIVGSRVQLLEG